MWNWPMIVVCLIITIMLILFRKNKLVKIYGKYLLIVIPFIILYVIKNIKTKNDTNTNTLSDEINEIKDQIIEDETISSIEITAIRTENEIVIKELEEIKKIPDNRERRKRLADLI